MLWAETVARQHSCTLMSLDVVGSNRAKNLYERQGFTVKEAGIYPVKMEKRLDALPEVGAENAEKAPVHLAEAAEEAPAQESMLQGKCASEDCAAAKYVAPAVQEQPGAITTPVVPQ